MVSEGSSDSANHKTSSPRAPIDNIGSPTAQSRVQTRTGSSSPWAQIVRGESETIAASSRPSPPLPLSPQPTMRTEHDASAAAGSSAASSSTSSPPAEKEYSGNESGPSGNAGKKPAWNKPSNKATEVGPVMGADSWPALSESTRAPANKSSSSESLKALADGSPSETIAQSAGVASSSAQKQVSITPNSSSTPTHTMPTRQKSFKRNNAASSSNSSLPHPVASQGSVAEAPLSNPTPRDQNPRGGAVSQAQGVNDNQQQRNSFRNRNGGPYPRGDGTQHQNYGGRRNQEHGNQNWHPHRNYSPRDMHMQPQRGFPRFPRNPPPPPPPATSAHFLGGPSIRPFGSPGFTDFVPPLYYAPIPPPPPPPPPPESLRGVPVVAPPLPPHPMFVPFVDPMLYTNIMSQLNYYFSDENLIKDTYLREHMDNHGWVPVTLIAGFKKMESFTNDTYFILDVARTLPLLEVQGDKIRRRGDWKKWLLSSSILFSIASNRQVQSSKQEALANGVQNLLLDENVSGSKLSDNKDSSRVTMQGESARFFSDAGSN